MKKFIYLFCIVLLTVTFLAAFILAVKEPSHRSGPFTIAILILAFVSPAGMQNSFPPPLNVKSVLVAVILFLLARRIYLFLANRNLNPPEQFTGLAYDMALVAIWCFAAAVSFVIFMAITFKGGGASFIPVFMSFMPVALFLPLSFLITEVKSLKSWLLTTP